MSGRLAWVASLAVVVAAGAVTALLVVFLFGGDGGDDDVPAVPTLARDVTLLAAPRDDAEPLATLQQGIPVAVTGRSDDGRWLAIEISGRDVSGWAPATAVDNVSDLDGLTVIAGAGAEAPPSPTTASGAPTQTPDFADLTVEDAFSRDNRLVVVIANHGDADVLGAVTVVVDGGAPRRIDVSGKPLRPGDALEAVLAEEYVQLRAQVLVEVRGTEGLQETDHTNNSFATVVTPDVPNDIGLQAMDLDAASRTLTLTLKNNSVIPLIGTVTIAVRQTTPSNFLIARFERALVLAVDGTQALVHSFDAGVDLPPLDALQVILSTDAINDAFGGNNILPR